MKSDITNLLPNNPTIDHVGTNHQNKCGYQENANISDVNRVGTGNDNLSQEFRLELDSHANMPVVGKGAQVEFTGRTADVNAFSPQYDTAQLPIVDAVVQYDCPYSGKTYMLLIRNALYVRDK